MNRFPSVTLDFPPYKFPFKEMVKFDRCKDQFPIAWCSVTFQGNPEGITGFSVKYYYPGSISVKSY